MRTVLFVPATRSIRSMTAAIAGLQPTMPSRSFQPSSPLLVSGRRLALTISTAPSFWKRDFTKDRSAAVRARGRPGDDGGPFFVTGRPSRPSAGCERCSRATPGDQPRNALRSGERVHPRPSIHFNGLRLAARLLNLIAVANSFTIEFDHRSRTMKYLNARAFVAPLATVAACSSNTPDAPSGNATHTFTATLRPSEEVPPVTGAESTGTGTVTITLTATNDASGNVSSATAMFAVNLTGFPAGTPINIAHIHQAAAGQSGNVVVSTSVAPGEVNLANGTGSFSRSGIAVTPDIASQLLSNPAGFYFNVHSTLNPGGVARGQLVRTQ